MYCPKCDNNTIVKDSRKVEKLVARRRECTSCGYSFYTEEVEVENGESLKYFWRFAQHKIKNTLTKSITKT